MIRQMGSSQSCQVAPDTLKRLTSGGSTVQSGGQVSGGIYGCPVVHH
jgi:hypothetical protein